jgi:tripartite-type tricarboxylate transporter receptor subunit TctC
MMKGRKNFLAILVLSVVVVSLAMLVPSLASAVSYPSKPVVAIVPFSPGGGNDILLRLVAKYITPSLGQSMIVENKPGAGGQIGWTTLSKARPDGYTIGATSLPSMILIKSLRQNVPFSLDDFQYVCNFQVDPIVWVVNKDSKFKTARDIVEFARANPKILNVAGDGPQSNVQLQHLVAAKLLKMSTNFVSYSGSGPALTALLGSKVDMAATTLSSAIPHIEGGRLRPVVLFYSTKMAAAPGTPTAKEAFGFEIPSIGMALRGIAAPKNVKLDQVAKLEKAFEAVSKSPEFLAQAKSLGLAIQFMGSKESTTLVKDSTKLVEQYKSLFEE